MQIWQLCNKGVMPRELPVAGEHATATSDQTLVLLLEELKATSDPDKVLRLSAEIERVVFHKQLETA